MRNTGIKNSNIFSGHIWSGSWAEAVAGDTRFKPALFDDNRFVIRKRKGPGILNRYLEYSAGEIACEVDPSSPDSTAQAMVGSEGWDMADVRHLALDSPFVEALKDRAVETGLPVKVIDDDEAWVLSLPGTFDGFLSSLPGGKRKKYSYYMNRVRKEKGIRFFFHEGAVEDAIERFMELHEERIRGKGVDTILSNKLYKDFFRNICIRYASSGKLRIAALKMDGRIEAMLLGIEENSVFYYMNSGFSNKAARYSPGIVMPLFCIEHSISRGLKEFNFLMGNDKYKQDMQAKPRMTKRVVIARNAVLLMMGNIIRRIRER